MRLVTKMFDGIIEVKEGETSSLVIENQDIFRRFLVSLYNQINGKEGEIILSEDDKELKISSKVDIIYEFVSFDINQKKLIAKIIATLEERALDEINFARTQKFLSEWELYVEELTDVFSCNVSFNSISMSSLLKASGVKVGHDYISEIEEVQDYMSLSCELLGERLFVYVNMRSYFTDEQMQMFIEYVINHKYKVILLESSARSLLKGEKRITVDCDLCVF